VFHNRDVSHPLCLYKELKMQAFQSKHNFTIYKISNMFRLLFCSHYQADPKNIKGGNNTVAILVGDLGSYFVLCKVYNVHNMYIMKNKMVGVKMYNYKIFMLG
jgi:hypothetical protein